MSYGIISIREYRGEHVCRGSLSSAEQQRARQAEMQSVSDGFPPSDVAIVEIINDFGRNIQVEIVRGEIRDQEDWTPPAL